MKLLHLQGMPGIHSEFSRHNSPSGGIQGLNLRLCAKLIKLGWKDTSGELHLTVLPSWPQKMNGIRIQGFSWHRREMK